ncbi:META domain-containing protein [Novosphingobium taihuense]|uniref:Heat shock protein HslJ n=1 Tax=Novosphingobium taihuense TaxID=260085 RepID=A0A7W7A9J9_9SPHN|nr:hypothetical protein [Novosphingobium taihuense]MBB4612210.1 heat shock protein HslJ [Novosphingobium taihuense]
MTSLSSIEGMWDVADFNGYVPARLNGSGWHEAFVMIGRRGSLSFRIGCNYSGTTGKVDARGIFRTSNADQITTLVLCEPERMKRDGQFFGLFKRSPSFERINRDRLLVRAGDDRLLLERPALRQKANIASLAQLQGDWQVLSVADQSAGGGSGFGLSDLPRLIRISDNRLWLTACPSEALAFKYESGRLITANKEDLPPCMSSAFRKALPYADAYRYVGKVLTTGPMAELGTGGILVLSAGRNALVLTRPQPVQDGSIGLTSIPGQQEPPPPPSTPPHP